MVERKAIVLGIALLFPFVGISKDIPVDSDSSAIVWTGYKITGKHIGSFTDWKAKVSPTTNNRIDVSININTDSLKVLDEMSDDLRTKLKNHLKSADFLDVGRFKESSFIGSIHCKQSDCIGKGQLRIKGISREVSFKATKKGTTEGAWQLEGLIWIKRRHWGIDYQKKSSVGRILSIGILNKVKIQFSLKYKTS